MQLEAVERTPMATLTAGLVKEDRLPARWLHQDRVLGRVDCPVSDESCCRLGVKNAPRALRGAAESPGSMSLILP
jgi:hypothetical protein